MNRRLRLYREGHPTLDGRVLVDTYWDGDPQPVMLMPQGHDEPELIGKVSDFRREDEGWVTGYVETTREVSDDLAAQANFDQVEWEYQGNVLLILSGARFRGIVFGGSPAWDGITIGEQAHDG